VMEGWHGVRFGSPLAATRETIQIVRAVTRGDRLQHDGRVYQLPLPGGPGRALRSPLEPAHVPIYVAALGPRNLELTGELADGWIGNTFIPEQARVFLDRLAAGAARAGRPLAELDLVIPVAVEFTDDLDAAARRHADGYAFTIGAMGAPGQNFYNDAFTRQGFGDDVLAVQELWRAGRRDEAAARVPAEGMRAIVANSGNANALAGPESVNDARAVCAAVAGALGIGAESVLGASTGVIGVRLPVAKLAGAEFAAFAATVATDVLGDAIAGYDSADLRAVATAGAALRRFFQGPGGRSRSASRRQQRHRRSSSF